MHDRREDVASRSLFRLVCDWGRPYVNRDTSDVPGTQQVRQASNWTGTKFRLFCDLIRKVSARNTSVGRSLLVGSIPSTKHGPPYSFTVFGPRDFREPTFLYIPEESDDQRFFGPNIANCRIAACDPFVCLQSSLIPELADEVRRRLIPRRPAVAFRQSRSIDFIERTRHRRRAFNEIDRLSEGNGEDRGRITLWNC